MNFIKERLERGKILKSRKLLGHLGNLITWITLFKGKVRSFTLHLKEIRIYKNNNSECNSVYAFNLFDQTQVIQIRINTEIFLKNYNCITAEKSYLDN